MKVKNNDKDIESLR